MKLSIKKQTFPELPDSFPKATSNFEHFETKDDLHSLCISKIPYCKKHL